VKTDASETTALQSYEPQPVPVVVSDPESIIRLALEKGAAVDVIERLTVVRNHLKAEFSKSEFDLAMKAFQAECPPIGRDKGVPDLSGRIAYKYAPMEKVEKIIRPLTTKHGFSHAFPEMSFKEGYVRVTCRVSHIGGHHEDTTVEYRIGTKTRLMSDTQVDAATETFAKRRALTNAYGIVIADEDNDGRQKQKPEGPSTVRGDKDDARDVANKKKLVDLTRSIHFCKGYNLTDDGKNKLSQFLWDETLIAPEENLQQLAGDRLASIVAKVEAKLKGQS